MAAINTHVYEQLKEKTRALSNGKKDDKPKHKFPDTSIFYYDCEKKGFRSFIAENLISFKIVNN